MKIFYLVGLVMFIVVLYFFSALIPLPWYIYPPFIVLFVVAFYWDTLAKYIPLDIAKMFNSLRPTPSTRKKTDSRRGKRI